MERMEGISGLTKLFRKSISDVPDGSLIVFIGSEAVCPPFAQLLAYSVRDRGMRFAFGPKASWEKCTSMKWMEGTGFQISTERCDPSEGKALVVLGGLAMPKFGCEVYTVNSFISRMPGRPKVVGLGFMSIFQRSGWDQLVKFDAMIDATMAAELK